MKCLFTLRAFLAPLFISITICTSAQPDYSFKSPTLESGTSLSVGAVYRFLNVKPGVSAKITVMSFNGGVTLNAIDETWTGFDEAFQPFILVNPNANGYVEFKVEFFSGVSNNLQVQNFIPVTCIDVDGVGYDDGTLYEKDQIQFFPGYYDYQMTGGNLLVSGANQWMVIKNISGFSYDGIDTTAKDVMATVVNRYVSGFLLRIGAENTSPTESEVRYRSVYFKRFNYGHPEPLAAKTILNLSGSKKQNGNELKVTLASGHTYDKMIIEKSSVSASSFSSIGEMNISAGGAPANYLSYLDSRAEEGVNNYYRVRLVKTQSGKEEISNILMIKDESNGTLKLYNTVIQASSPVLTLQSAKSTEASVRIVDLSGRILYSGNMKLNAGTNSINLSPINRSVSYAVATIETKDERKSVKVLIQ